MTTLGDALTQFSPARGWPRLPAFAATPTATLSPWASSCSALGFSVAVAAKPKAAPARSAHPIDIARPSTTAHAVARKVRVAISALDGAEDRLKEHMRYFRGFVRAFSVLFPCAFRGVSRQFCREFADRLPGAIPRICRQSFREIVPVVLRRSPPYLPSTRRVRPRTLKNVLDDMTLRAIRINVPRASRTITRTDSNVSKISAPDRVGISGGLRNTPVKKDR
jgi:hypothetical protein